MRPFGSPLVIECFELSEFADFRIGQVFGDLDLDGDIEVPGLGSALFGTDPLAADTNLPACIRSFGDFAGNLFAVITGAVAILLLLALLFNMISFVLNDADRNFTLFQTRL